MRPAQRSSTPARFACPAAAGGAVGWRSVLNCLHEAQSVDIFVWSHMSDMPHKRRSFWIMLGTQFAMYLFTTLFFVIAAIWAIPSAFDAALEFEIRVSSFYEFTLGIMYPVIHYWYLFVSLSFLGYVVNVATLYGLGCLPDKARWCSVVWFALGLMMMVLFLVYIAWMVIYPHWMANSMMMNNAIFPMTRISTS
ncbi:MAG: hypothetical protein NZ807_03750 [Dehalococcoidia bacterium]|nr:hypothetical protein [Dehalococcoidia bacterium]